MTITLTSGQRYNAEISLGMLESLAGNDTIRNKLTDAGFTNVLVTGSGSNRRATGTWNGPTRAVELPKQVTRVW